MGIRQSRGVWAGVEEGQDEGAEKVEFTQHHGEDPDDAYRNDWKAQVMALRISDID